MIVRRPAPLRTVLLLIMFGVVNCAVLFDSCHNNTEPPSVASQIADGKVLAQKYCVSCHMFPAPGLIDRKSWVNGVLPAMAKNLNVHSYMGEYYTDQKSVLNVSDWQKIVTYYTRSAPVNLDIPKPAQAPLKEWSIFSLIRPKNISIKVPAMTTMVSIDTTSHKVYSGDAGGNLIEWDARLNSKLVHHFDSPVTGATYLKTAESSNTAIITCIGNLPPVNLATGKVYSLDLSAVKKNAQPGLIASRLPRPVASVAADFNKDGLMDYVTCGFGHDNGGLYYLQQQRSRILLKKQHHPRPRKAPPIYPETPWVSRVWKVNSLWVFCGKEVRSESIFTLLCFPNLGTQSQPAAGGLKARLKAARKLSTVLIQYVSTSM